MEHLLIFCKHFLHVSSIYLAFYLKINSKLKIKIVFIHSWQICKYFHGIFLQKDRWKSDNINKSVEINLLWNFIVFNIFRWQTHKTVRWLRRFDFIIFSSYGKMRVPIKCLHESIRIFLTNEIRESMEVRGVLPPKSIRHTRISI